MKQTGRRARFAILGLLGPILASIPLHAQDMHKGSGDHRFDDPAKWSATFDDPARDQWQMPDRIIAALNLRPTDLVADIGAGTGYMAVRFARHLKAGTVFAVDLEPKMVAHLAARAKASGIANLRAIAATEASPNLPERVDVVFLLDVYHHMSQRPAYFKRLRASLKPGARVAIIDFRPESPVGAPKHLRLSVDQITREMIVAGYAPAESLDFLPRQNFLVFQAPD